MKKIIFSFLAIMGIQFFLSAQEEPVASLIEAIANAVGIESKVVNSRTRTSLNNICIGLPAVKEFAFFKEMDSLGNGTLRQMVYPIREYEGSFTLREFNVRRMIEERKEPEILYNKMINGSEPFIVYKKGNSWVVNKDGNELDNQKKIHQIIEDTYGNPYWIVSDEGKKEKGRVFYLLKNWQRQFSLLNLSFPKDLDPVKFAPENREIAYIKEQENEYYISRISNTGSNLGEYSLGSGGVLEVIDYTYSKTGNRIATITLEREGSKSKFNIYINGVQKYSSEKWLTNIGVKETGDAVRWICLSDQKLILIDGRFVLKEDLASHISTSVIGNNKFDYFDIDGNPFFVIVHKEGDELIYSIFYGNNKIADLYFVPNKQVSFLKEQGIDIEENLIEEVDFDVNKNFIGVIRSTSIVNKLKYISDSGLPELGFRLGNRFVNSFDVSYKLGYTTYFADLFLKRRVKKPQETVQKEAKPAARKTGKDVKSTALAEEDQVILLSVPSYVKPQVFWSDDGKNYGVLFAFGGLRVENYDRSDLEKIRKSIIKQKVPYYQVMINDRLLPFYASPEVPKIVFSKSGGHFAFIGKSSDGSEFVVTDQFISQPFYQVLDLDFQGNSLNGMAIRKNEAGSFEIVKISQPLS